MSKSNRNNPRRAQSSEATFTRFEFDQMFPDDAACLEWLFEHRYPNGVYCPNCEKVTKHYREKNRPSYSCQCGHHAHPLKGTIFEDSATSLRLWFLAIYLVATTRCGISSKHLEREIGVTYKTAWRMNKLIKKMLSEDVLSLLGEIEVDESFYGGSDKNRHPNKKKKTAHGGMQPVFGMVERNGKVVTAVIPRESSHHILPRIKQKILPKRLPEMASQQINKNNGWHQRKAVRLTRDDVVRHIETEAQARFGISAQTFLARFRSGELEDTSGVTDLLVYSDLIAPDDPIFGR